MTGFELLDLRMSYVQSMLNIFRFWVSLTFALVVAAQVVGPDMGSPGVLAATLLYLLTSLASFANIRRFGVVTDDIAIDIQALVEEELTPPTVMRHAKSAQAHTITILAIMCLGIAGATIYAFYRADAFGFIG